MEWTRILAYITGTVDQELLLRNEYLAAENRILKAQLKGCLKLSDAERAKLGEIGHRLGRKSLSEVATTALVPVVNQIRTYWWCSPPRTGRQRMVPASLTARETGASFSKDKCVLISL